MSYIRPTTTDAILEAAFIEFAQNPGAPLAVVAKRAGVGRATLHRHFRTRTDLVYALAKQAGTELESAATTAAKGAKSYTDALRSIMAAVIDLGDRQWFLAHENLSAFDDLCDERKRQNQEFEELMKAVQKEGLFPLSCPMEWAIATYDHLIYAAWMMTKDGHATSRQAANLAWTTFIRGIEKTSL